MKILIVTQYFFPEDFRINGIAEELVQRGHYVEVVTAMPNYPTGTIFTGYEKKIEEDYKNIRIHRTNTRPRYTGSINLFRNYLSFVIQARKRIKKLSGSFDVVFCYMPSPVFQLSPSIYAKEKFGCPLICMCCDQWPESLKARGLEKGPIYQMIARYCRKVFNKCDYILNVAPSFIEYNNSINGVPKNKMDWCVQHCEDSFQGLDMTKTENLETIDLMFAGNIGYVQNVEDIVKAYEVLGYENLKIHIFGDGSLFDNVKAYVSRKGLEKNILLYGRVSNKELSEYYKKMDACLLTLSGKSAIGNTIPSKLTGYLSAGKTVIAAIGGDSRQLISEADCGLCTEPDDYMKLAEIIREYYMHREKYSTCGANGRQYYEKYCTLDYFVSKLETIFSNLQ